MGMALLSVYHSFAQKSMKDSEKSSHRRGLRILLDISPARCYHVTVKIGFDGEETASVPFREGPALAERASRITAAVPLLSRL